MRLPPGSITMCAGPETSAESPCTRTRRFAGVDRPVQVLAALEPFEELGLRLGDAARVRVAQVVRHHRAESRDVALDRRGDPRVVGGEHGLLGASAASASAGSSAAARASSETRMGRVASHRASFVTKTRSQSSGPPQPRQRASEPRVGSRSPQFGHFQLTRRNARPSSAAAPTAGHPPGLGRAEHDAGRDHQDHDDREAAAGARLPLAACRDGQPVRAAPIVAPAAGCVGFASPSSSAPGCAWSSGSMASPADRAILCLRDEFDRPVPRRSGA